MYMLIQKNMKSFIHQTTHFFLVFFITMKQQQHKTSWDTRTCSQSIITEQHHVNCGHLMCSLWKDSIRTVLASNVQE